MGDNLIDELVSYIEMVEVAGDEEWGSCRNIEKLLHDADMPAVYYKLIELKTKKGSVK